MGNPIEENVRTVCEEFGLKIIDIDNGFVDCVDRDGYKYNIKMDSQIFKNKSKPNRLNRNRYSESNIRHYLEKNHHNVELLDFKYKDANTRNIPFVCNIHAEHGIQYKCAYDILKGKVCKYCNRSNAQD